ncbi:MAG: OmpH family outer membrane protein [Phycisphaerae bacterium]
MLIQFLSFYLLFLGQGGDGANVAVINVADASEKYARTRDLEAEFEQRRIRLREEGDQFREQIEQKRRILAEQLKPGTDAFNTTREELAVLEARAQFFVESQTRMMDEALARSLRSIYLDIQATVSIIAQEQGIEVVLAIDALPGDEASTPTTAKQQILLQKVVYWNPRRDITETVISRLNANYAIQKQQPGNGGNSTGRPSK